MNILYIFNFEKKITSNILSRKGQVGNFFSTVGRKFKILFSVTLILM